jgi:amino acid transporter
MIALVHALLQVIAFCVVLPAGVLIAIFRQYIGAIWLPLHIACQLIGSAMVLVAVALMRMSHKDHDDDHEDKKFDPHKIVGYTVLALIIVELLWALVARRFVPYVLWLWIHVFLAFAILAGGWLNIYLALKMRNRCKDEDCHH